MRVENPSPCGVRIGSGVLALATVRAAGLMEPISREEATRLERLFELHHDRIWRLALRMTGRPAVAEDLMQETFLRASVHRRRLPVAEAAARAWLTRTLVNLCRDRARRHAVRQRHRNRVVSPPGGEIADSPESLATAHQRLNAAMNELSARRRAVLVLRELDGLDDAEIARLLGLRRATVRWHLAAARRHVRARLRAEEP